MNTRIIVLASACLLVTPAALAAQQIDRRAPTGPRPTVEVNNVQGKVTVVAWDRQEVQLTGVLENDKHTLEFTADQGRVVVKVRPDSKSYRYGSKDDAILELSVPSGSTLDVQTVSADIDVSGVRGTQRLEAVSGDITTTVFDEQLDVRSISGDAVIHGSGGKAKVYAESTSGNVVARGLGGALQAKSVSGDLDLELGVTPSLRLETVSGDIGAKLTLAEDARLDAQTVSGDIKLGFGKPVNGEFDIETFSGGIDNCFGPPATRKSEYGPGRELRFTQGTGAARVGLETLSGDISFCDR